MSRLWATQMLLLVGTYQGGQGGNDSKHPVAYTSNGAFVAFLKVGLLAATTLTPFHPNATAVDDTVNDTV